MDGLMTVCHDARKGRTIGSHWPNHVAPPLDSTSLNPPWFPCQNVPRQQFVRTLVSSDTATLDNWSADIALKMTNVRRGWCRLVGMVILVRNPRLANPKADKNVPRSRKI